MHDNTAAISLVAIKDPFFFDVGSLYQHLENLTDRRDPHGVRYPLAVALVFIILAKLAGEQEPRGIAQWIALRKDLLKSALHFERDTTPAAITYSRILGEAVDVNELQRAVTSFLLCRCDAGQGVEVNLDGKALRGTIPAGQRQGCKQHVKNHTKPDKQQPEYEYIPQGQACANAIEHCRFPYRQREYSPRRDACGSGVGQNRLQSFS